MPTITTTRTTSFRLSPEHFGTVFVHRGGRRFSLAWRGVADEWRRQRHSDHERYLPHRSLRTALQLMTGDLIRFEPWKDERADAFLISRQPIDEHSLERAVTAWELTALKREDRPLSSVLDDLTSERLSVAELVERRREQCPTVPSGAGWVWEVALWDIAHRLAGEQLETDAGPVPLRLVSDGSLLTWARLVRPTRNPERAAAMHHLNLHLITIPGVEEPAVSVLSSVARLAPSWQASIRSRSAWAELDATAPILRAGVTPSRTDDVWHHRWSDQAAEVLRLAHLHPLPDPEDGIGLDGPVRSGFGTQPSSHPIGRGPGPRFHEIVAHHLKRTLGPSAVPLELESVGRRWGRADRIAPRVAASSLSIEPVTHVHLVYATTETRARMAVAVAAVLAGPTSGTDDASVPEAGTIDADTSKVVKAAEALKHLPDGEVMRCGPMGVSFTQPPQASRWLLAENPGQEILDWLDTWLPALAGDGRHAALVETLPVVDNQPTQPNRSVDPKPELRRAMAKRGVVSQFLRHERTETAGGRRRDESKDYAAENAVIDLLRSSGIFLRAFPVQTLPAGTLVVGIHATRWTKRTTKRKTMRAINLVAAELGTNQAWGYNHDGGWQDLHTATAAFLATDHHDTDADLRRMAERAIGQLPARFGKRPTVLVFGASGCARLWGALSNDISEPLPRWMRSGGNAVVRVRTDPKMVPRPAGVGPWDDGFRPANFADFRPTQVVGPQGSAPMFVLSGSKTMGRTMSQRKQSRFTVDDNGLRNDWHSLSATELLVLDSGQFERAAVEAQLAILCRAAPSWTGVLRWPSPLHLARAVMDDHPHGATNDPGSPDEDGNAGQLQFDW